MPFFAIFAPPDFAELAAAAFFLLWASFLADGAGLFAADDGRTGEGEEGLAVVFLFRLPSRGGGGGAGAAARLRDRDDRGALFCVVFFLVFFLAPADAPRPLPRAAPPWAFAMVRKPPLALFLSQRNGSQKL